MASCTLQIDDRLIARAEGGSFEHEYALFEAHEIELRSNNEPGTVREHGYRTTVELAVERLDSEGVTASLASATADALGSLVAAYALGPEVRRVASLLGPAELFEGRTWRAADKEYDGGWLDVAGLAADVGVSGAARSLQAVFLRAHLGQLAPDAVVYLSTADYTAARRPGERSHKRVSLASVHQIPTAVAALADRGSARPPREKGPPRAELLDAVRRRLAANLLAPARASLETVERTLAIRERPARGPLADADLWALELQLSDGDTASAAEKIDALERSRGRHPATAYLRERTAFLLGVDDPRRIAERVSSLAMSMSSFAELELLAAEAWSRAGDRKRALAYARNLAENPQVDASLRRRADAIVDPPSAPAPARPSQPLAVPERPSQEPQVAPPPQSESTPSARAESSPMVSITAGMRGSVAPTREPSAPPPQLVDASFRNRSTQPAPHHREGHPSEAPAATDVIAPTPIMSIGSVLERRPSAPPRADVGPPSVAPSSVPTRPSIPVARLQSSPPATVTPSLVSSPPLAPTSEASPSAAPSPADDDEVVVRGGSRPPLRTEPPPSTFPAAPLVPRLDRDVVENAETLSLPPGLQAESGAIEPTSPLEARVYFTHRTRELGRLYRQRYDVELRTDLRSVEIAQHHLAERFPDGALQTFDDLAEVRLHGAFLSELLARRLGAEWTDMAPTEMGYWTMNVPPGTTIWPIGRVLRYVAMRHKERDLVSYYLELQARAHRL